MSQMSENCWAFAASFLRLMHAQYCQIQLTFHRVIQEMKRWRSFAVVVGYCHILTHSTVDGQSLGICIGELELASWLVVIPWPITTSGVSAVVYGSAMSIANGLAVPKPPSQVSAGLSVPGRNSTSGTVFTSRPSVLQIYWIQYICVLVTSWSWWRAVGGPTPGGVKTGSDQFPGALGWSQLAGQIGATYVTVWIRVYIYYRHFRQTIAYLLRKIWAVCRS